MRNLAARLPKDIWPGFEVLAQVAYRAPSRAVACELVAGVVALCKKVRRRGRLLRRRLRSSRRSSAFPRHTSARCSDHALTGTPLRLGAPSSQDIPNALGERAVLKHVLIRAGERWKSMKVTEFERR